MSDIFELNSVENQSNVYIYIYTYIFELKLAMLSSLTRSGKNFFSKSMAPQMVTHGITSLRLRKRRH